MSEEEDIPKQKSPKKPFKILLDRIREDLEDKDEDLRSLLEPLARSGTNLILLDDLIDELKDVTSTNFSYLHILARNKIKQI